jgi:Haem-binding domain
MAMFKKILLVLLIVLIGVQLIQPPHNNGSAESAMDITHAVQVPDTVMALLKIACYDCHSDYTRYPWYSKITPVNWWLNNHIKGGKRNLNFSEFNKGSFRRKIHKLEETADQVEKHQMPIGSYLWIHKDARLNEAQRKTIIDWTNNARQQLQQDSLKKPNTL